MLVDRMSSDDSQESQRDGEVDVGDIRVEE